MNQDELKAAVADAAIAEIKSTLEKDTILGIGTGSTANLFIDRLGPLRHLFKGAVASSESKRQAP
ncbi:hypothetical protein HSBAA_00450 [Vreelandella sulfidaeris]|uniref:Ribose-5-phosphate isomerase n=1 Tax=Vreelandella sulfidaeris TaxID=115553 RepID=A0A455U1Y4_9GAMM|nr:hypothetical protein HSBAA_00450 [Halomonas sulfidaeris]